MANIMPSQPPSTIPADEARCHEKPYTLRWIQFMMPCFRSSYADHYVTQTPNTLSIFQNIIQTPLIVAYSTAQIDIIQNGTQSQCTKCFISVQQNCLSAARIWDGLQLFLVLRHTINIIKY